MSTPQYPQTQQQPGPYQQQPGPYQQQYAPQGQQPWPHVPPAPPVPPKKKSWFARHKIMTTLGIIVLAFIMISAINSAGGGGNDTAGDSNDTAQGAPAAEKDTKDDAKKEEAKPGLNTPVVSGDIEFTVTKVEKGVKQVGSSDFGQKAQGQYVLVSVSMKNVGKEGVTVWSTQKLKDDQDRTFESDESAAIYIKDNDGWWTQINPGNTAKGVMVFDMPKDAKPTSILLQGGMLDAEVEVQLS
ncbi:DUF4352 domain-containing protein [Propionibacteriaceae bacterium Y1700]|uniref:DUF4352 domain-containing protein n=1 Tax=Microlunatus sp. Y1700 TaxID=3418487 RepID=UPI003DA764F0